MFENLIKFFNKTKNKDEKKETGKSKNAAKERLHLVLMQDRANVSADFLELMKQEIIDVIKKYIEVDEKAIDVRLTNKENEDGTNGAPALYANIPIVSIKNEARQVDKKQIGQHAEKTEEIEQKEESEVKEEKEPENENIEQNIPEEKNIEEKSEKQEREDIPPKTEQEQPVEEKNVNEEQKEVVEEVKKAEEIVEEIGQADSKEDTTPEKSKEEKKKTKKKETKKEDKKEEVANK